MFVHLVPSIVPSIVEPDATLAIFSVDIDELYTADITVYPDNAVTFEVFAADYAVAAFEAMDFNDAIDQIAAIAVAVA